MTPKEIRAIENTELKDGNFLVLREMCAQLAILNEALRSVMDTGENAIDVHHVSIKKPNQGGKS